MIFKERHIISGSMDGTIKIWGFNGEAKGRINLSNPLPTLWILDKNIISDYNSRICRAL